MHNGQNLSFWYIVKVYIQVIRPFIMVVKIVKSDNPKRSYAHLTFGVLKSMKMEKLAFIVSKGFIIVSIAN